MKNILLTSGAILFLIFFYFISLTRGKTDLDKPQLTIYCKGNVHFDLEKPDSRVIMEGSVSLTTLGSKRLAIGFTGQLITGEGRFTLSRTLMMNSRYHPENHVMEVDYASTIVRDIDTAPDTVFYHALITSNAFILRLTQFSDNALLVSEGTTPLYVCLAR